MTISIANNFGLTARYRIDPNKRRYRRVSKISTGQCCLRFETKLFPRNSYNVDNIISIIFIHHYNNTLKRSVNRLHLRPV